MPKCDCGANETNKWPHHDECGLLTTIIPESKMPALIFVFGSNEAGIHGAGAARYAYEKKGARYGKSYGHYGDSFAIPTKDECIVTLPLMRIHQYVLGFLAYAHGHHKIKFEVTAIGCGLAGYKHSEIAPLFVGAPKNCRFDMRWKPYLGESYTYFEAFE